MNYINAKTDAVARVKYHTRTLPVPVKINLQRCNKHLHLFTQRKCTVQCHFSALYKRTVYLAYSARHELSCKGESPNDTLFIIPMPNTVAVAAWYWNISQVALQCHPSALFLKPMLQHIWWNTWCGFIDDKKEHLGSSFHYRKARATTTLEWQNRCRWREAPVGTDKCQSTRCI